MDCKIIPSGTSFPTGVSLELSTEAFDELPLSSVQLEVLAFSTIVGGPLGKLPNGSASS